ncbi:TRAP transporter large permease subunit [Roseinatronobacter sp. S2]|uniref:TRAP transporter large permease subunit n=1 Tax=Roseinatronobacter sp. S2 TaxID=3035471 RepID=UPI002795FA32|nr:TRAP transporter large permease subunit [Roseinatronobacter sp. S2]
MELSANPLVLLFVLNFVLLVVGMVLEAIVAILIIAPIVTPAMMAARVVPKQLSLVFVLNLMIGLLTPPIGMSLYMISIVSRESVPLVVRGVAPFYIPLFAALALVTVFPSLSTWLPNLAMR